MHSIDWDDLRFVLALGRTQSYAGAARQLRVNESTVVRRIARLEQRLSARLFERCGGLLQATEVGVDTILRAERIELEVQATESGLTGVNDQAAGTVRVTAACLFTNHIVAPALPALLDANPHLRVELVADGRDLSLANREADVAIRLARPQTETRSVVKRVGHLSYGVYCVKRRKHAPLPWIAYDDRLRDLPQARWIMERMLRDRADKPQVLINDAETLLRCVKLGLGKSVLPVVVGAADPSLVRIELDAPAMSREIWLMVHADLRQLRRIRVVMDWLAALSARL